MIDWKKLAPMKRETLAPQMFTMRKESPSEGVNNYIIETSAKLRAVVAELEDEEICRAIMEDAREAGFTDLYLIDKDFIREAILREVARRRGEAYDH